jgi:hypothetical protein
MISVFADVLVLSGLPPNSAPISSACICAASASRALPSDFSWFSMPR